MKKILIILSLSLAFLTSCDKSTTDNNTQPNTNKTSQVTQTETTETVNNDSKLDPENENKETKLNEDKKENLEDKEKSTDENEKDESEMTLSELYDASDYVAILRMTQTGANGYEVNINEDFKGSLNNIVMPKINGIEPNQDYLVFMKDSPEGDIVATTPESIFVVDGREDKNVAATREIYESRLRLDNNENADKTKEKKTK